MQESAYNERFFGGYRFFDEQTGFLLNFAGVAGFNLEAAVNQYKAQIGNSLHFMKRIEAQETVNVSEGRKVDHFNLRLGEGLDKSVQQWKIIKKDVEQILSGSVRNDSGQSYTDVIVNGIGGSYLGPLMVLIAKQGNDFNVGNKLPVKIHFVSNTDPESFDILINKLDLARTIMINISKSGSTAETAGNLEVFNAMLKAKGLPQGKHNMTVTTPGSPFDKYSQENHFLHIYSMNTETGGRTSVGSAVGMVPAAFGGLDFEQFLKGEAYMDELTRRDNVLENPAMIIALAIHDAIQRLGHQNQIVLGYSDSLKETAHYFQQLFMESLGKNMDLEDKKAVEPTGLTIFGGVGTGEQHAFMQQVQKGIRDAFVHFISFRKRSKDFGNKKAGSMGRQMLAFVEGTQQALRSNEREYLSLVFERQNEFNMGMLVALEERVVVFLAGFWGINPFDQPGVQDGKLSADNHNKLALEVEAKLAHTDTFQGNARAFAAYMGINPEEAPRIEAILNDIEANYRIQGAYPLLSNLSITRRWQENGFAFTIKHE
jgi:glucose-6-phosphate isomerase